jgi:protein TonB
MHADTRHFNYPMPRTFLYSAAGHASLLLLLIVIGWLAPTRKQHPKITWANIRMVQVSMVAPESESKPLGEERTNEVENAATPTPKPRPKPTPAPTPQKETIKVPKEPTPTPKSDKKSAPKKKKIEPTPEPTPEEKPTPKPTAPPKQQRVTPAPTPVPTVPPLPRRPRPEAKGDPGGSTPPGTVAESPIQFEQGVTFPGDYVTDAWSRLQANFKPPSYDRTVRVCVIRFTVRSNGKITDIKVQKSSGVEGLDRIAERAVKDTASFRPFSQYTKRAEITASIPFQFGRP